MDKPQEILVFPRTALPEGGRFVPWANAGPVIDAVAESMTWMPRDAAEQSPDWLQPIPCAIIRNDQQEYRVLRRVKHGRADLSSRVSLVVGGHIDRCSPNPGLDSLLSTTLEREIYEELGVNAPSEIKPIGVVVDTTSGAASRHIGFVYEIVITDDFKPRANEEFSTESVLNGRLYTPAGLSQFLKSRSLKSRSLKPSFLKEFDPWSRIIFADYIAPAYSADIGTQPELISL